MSLMAYLFVLGSHISSASDVLWVTADTTYHLRASELEGHIWVPLSELSRAWKAGLEWDLATMRVTLTSDGHEVEFVPEDPFFVVDGEIHHLPVPPRMLKGELHVPLDLLLPYVSSFVRGKLKWKEGGVNILGVSIEERANGTLIVVRTSEPLRAEAALASGWLHLTLYRGRLDTTAMGSLGPEGAVREVRAYQYSHSAQISFRLKPGVSDYRMYPSPDPKKVVVLLWQRAKKPRKQEMWAYRTVIIDPGHGGRDEGAVGPTGLKEKDVALDIALRLAKLLREELGMQVVLTRTEDVFVPLQERARIAVNGGGQLFISLHCNSSKNPKVVGIETYFLSEAKTEDAREVARRENASLRFEEVIPSLKEDNFPLKDILTDMLSDQFLKESQKLAACVQEELVRGLGLEDRGVKQAGFYVMLGTGAAMPSVLVELGFISNRGEERLLKTSAFRRRAALALFRAIRNFKEQQERAIALQGGR
ncbi:MAG TPA: hypothetical protein EYP61_03885 [Candidatus Latescibacteria bacterium]|nr:hypothetical protein [Candidatus Latescibacterota bacterium]